MQLPSDTPALDAQVLLAHILKQPRTWLLAHPEAELSEGQLAQWQTDLQRLGKGEPLPYILGHWEFYGLDFLVSPAVLIPRPETELLVEHALDWLTANPERKAVADIGTGSGCIAVTLAANAPHIHITAVDISKEALSTAEENAHNHKAAERISFLNSDLLEKANRPFDLVCANLPYVPRNLLPALDVYKHEPALALDGGPQGLDLIERLLKDAPRVLASDALLLLEIEAGQGQSAAELGQRHFPEAEIAVLPDLAGKPRLLRIET